MSSRAHRQDRGVQKKQHARNAHDDAGNPQSTVSHTLARLLLVLIGHVNPLGHEQIRQEQNHPLLVVFGPMANVVVNNVLHTSRCHDGADDGNQHEHDAEDAMAHTECEDHIRTHHGCQRRHEHESAREHQPHAAANGDAMRPASLPGVALDIAFASNFTSAQERFIFSLFFRRDVELSVLTHGHRPLSCQWEGSR